MDQSTNAVNAAPSPAAASTNASPSDIESIVADAVGQVESLNALAAEAIAATAANPAPAEPDFAEMERQIQSLLDQSAEAPAGGSPTAATGSVKPTGPSRDIRNDSIEEEPVDPLLKEIDAALADDADTLLRGADGDIGQAVRSVFDERALSGQEEDVNRALIEAFGTSRVDKPSFESSAISNPLPGFEGSARELSPDIPRQDRDRTPVATDDASVEPTPAAAETVSPTQTAASHQVEGKAPEAAPVKSTAAESTVARPAAAPMPSEPTRTSAPAADAAVAGSSIIESKSDTRPSRGLIGAIAVLPIKLLGAPTRALPGAARTIVGIAAVTLALWTPAAWWFAVKSSKTPAVAPITIKPAPEAPAAEAPAAAASSGGGHEAKAEEPATSGGGHH